MDAEAFAKTGEPALKVSAGTLQHLFAFDVKDNARQFTIHLAYSTRSMCPEESPIFGLFAQILNNSQDRCMLRSAWFLPQVNSAPYDRHEVALGSSCSKITTSPLSAICGAIFSVKPLPLR